MSPSSKSQGDAGASELRDEDERFMRLALDQARLAEEVGEVPIGCVVVLNGEVIAAAHNQTRTLKDPTAHAEILALREAARHMSAMRLPGATVYTTVEPCFMCAGACSHARASRVVWGVPDPKFGGCVSLGNVLTHEGLNHRAEITEGVCAAEAKALIQQFFRNIRRRT